MDKPKVPKKKYNKFKRNILTNEWEFQGIEEQDYDYKVVNSQIYKYVPIKDEIQEILREDLQLDKPITHKVTTTPNMNESEAMHKPWYSSPLFIYIFWPVLVGIIIYLLTKLF